MCDNDKYGQIVTYGTKRMAEREDWVSRELELKQWDPIQSVQNEVLMYFRHIQWKILNNS